MSDYKEYRPKARITARVVERTIKIPQTIQSSSDNEYLTVTAGDYEVLADDGTVSYQSKADFESANEPVRRERQAKALTKKKAGNQKDKDKALPAAQG